jgi:hypothetical protein
VGCGNQLPAVLIDYGRREGAEVDHEEHGESRAGAQPCSASRGPRRWRRRSRFRCLTLLAARHRWDPRSHPNSTSVPPLGGPSLSRGAEATSTLSMSKMTAKGWRLSWPWVCPMFRNDLAPSPSLGLRELLEGQPGNPWLLTTRGPKDAEQVEIALTAWEAGNRAGPQDSAATAYPRPTD